MGRRMCPSCGKNYNVADIHTDDGYSMNPLLPKIDPHKCDVDGVKLIIRDDDKESIIKDRLELYKSKTQPILDYYKKSNKTKVVDFEAKKGVDDYPEIKKIVQRELNL